MEQSIKPSKANRSIGFGAIVKVATKDPYPVLCTVANAKRLSNKSEFFLDHK